MTKSRNSDLIKSFYERRFGNDFMTASENNRVAIYSSEYLLEEKLSDYSEIDLRNSSHTSTPFLSKPKIKLLPFFDFMDVINIPKKIKTA